MLCCECHADLHAWRHCYYCFHVLHVAYNLLSVQVPVKTSQHETVRTNGHVAQAGSNSPTEVAGGIIPWFSQRVQTGTKQA